MLGSRPIWGDWRAGMGMDAARQAQLQLLADAIERRLRRYGQGADRFGLIHADLRLANLLLEGPTTKVIDFDDCGFGWYLYDLGAALSFIEHRPDVPELVDAWVRGYRRVAPLAAEDEAEIPTFILLRRLLLVAWIGSHAETDLAQSMGEAYTEGSCALAEDAISSASRLSEAAGSIRRQCRRQAYFRYSDIPISTTSIAGSQPRSQSGPNGNTTGWGRPICAVAMSPGLAR